MRVLVIGGGPGGYVAAIRAAQLGGEVMLAEKGEFGGTCLNVGCIPTKVLLHATELLEQIKHVSDYGINVGAPEFDWAKLQKKKSTIVKRLTSGIAGLLRANKITVYSGAAQFLDHHTAKISLADGSSNVVPFDKAIIATGSSSVAIPLPGADLPFVVNSDDALSFAAPPASMVIVGGGVIGVEMATVYARLGSKITIVEALDRILPNMDAELVELAAAALKQSGVEIRTGCKVSAFEPAPGGGTVIFDDGGKTQTRFCEKALVSVGRRPFTQGLGLETLNLEMKRAAIRTGGYMQTSLPHVYAIGDCTGGMMLAHTASAMGMVAADHAVTGCARRYDQKTTPSCVYTEPELAGVGLTEEQARECCNNVAVGRFNLAANGKTAIMGGSGLVKFVVDGDTQEILGLHILGPRATDMIVEGALALRLEATVDEIISTIHAHPTVAESMLEAALDVKGLAIHAH